MNFVITMMIEYIIGGLSAWSIPLVTLIFYCEGHKFYNLLLIRSPLLFILVVPFLYFTGLFLDWSANSAFKKIGIGGNKESKAYDVILHTKPEPVIRRVLGFEAIKRFLRINSFALLINVIASPLYIVAFQKVDYGSFLWFQIMILCYLLLSLGLYLKVKDRYEEELERNASKKR
ncbi:hypothetical protein IT417_03590 [bacterium]|nr:hypothetical protein [bacterium]